MERRAQCVEECIAEKCQEGPCRSSCKVGVAPWEGGGGAVGIPFQVERGFEVGTIYYRPSGRGCWYGRNLWGHGLAVVLGYREATADVLQAWGGCNGCLWDECFGTVCFQLMLLTSTSNCHGTGLAAHSGLLTNWPVTG